MTRQEETKDETIARLRDQRDHWKEWFELADKQIHSMWQSEAEKAKIDVMAAGLTSKEETSETLAYIGTCVAFFFAGLVLGILAVFLLGGCY